MSNFNGWTSESVTRLIKNSAGPVSVKAKAHRPKNKMNKTEAAYARLLEARKQVGEIIDWKFGSVNLRVGEGKCFYETDFFVVARDGTIEIHEVKGFWRDDALVKIKAAASQYPFRFIAARLLKGAWEYRHFNE